MKNFIVGAQLYSVRNLMQTAKDVDSTFAAIKKMGYNTVQLSGQSRDIPDEVIAELLQKHALACVVTHNSMQDFEEDLDATIARHKTWHCAYAGLGGLPGEFRTGVEGYKDFALRANGFARKLADNGIHFVYHNHCFEFVKYDGVTGMQVMEDNFSSDVQFELDTYWVQAGGENPVDYIRRLNGRIEIMHFKDMAGSAENKPLISPIGKGNLHWQEIKKACEETAVTNALVEQDNAADMENPLGELEFSANYLKKEGFIL